MLSGEPFLSTKNLLKLGPFHQNRWLILYVKDIWSPAGIERAFLEVIFDFVGTFEPLLWSGEGTALWSGDSFLSPKILS